MAFPVYDVSELPTRATRTSKTTPLRNALSALSVGEAIEVAYDTHDQEGGYKATTISQVAGAMSLRSSTVKFSVRRKDDGTGCYLIAGPKPDETAPRRGRKAKAEVDADA